MLCAVKRRLPRLEPGARPLFPLKPPFLLWKLCSGAIARVDLYTDMLFLVILHGCSSNRALFIVSLVSIVLSLSFPLWVILFTLLSSCCRRLANPNTEFKRLERLARLSYSSEFKGMGAVFGSYCADLKIRCGRRERSVPRLHAFSKLLL